MLRYEELPDRVSERTLCLFAHYDRDDVVDPYVVRYLDALHKLGAAIVFVSACPQLVAESADMVRPFCVGIYADEQPSMDFGSWFTGWCALQHHGFQLESFDRIVFANDSVYGPLFPLDDMWAQFHGADMYGAIESHEYVPHLQSWLWAFDLNARTIPFLKGFWYGFRETSNKGELIMRYEIGMSMLAREAGLTLKPFVSADAADAAYRAGGGLRACENKTIEYWDGLIEQFRFPYLKRLVAARRPHHLPDVIARTDYPYELIEGNCNRLSRNRLQPT